MGGVGGFIVAAACGVGVVGGIATQGVLIMRGLQENFDWKGVRDMAEGAAVSGKTAMLTPMIDTHFEGANNVLIRKDFGVNLLPAHPARVRISEA